MRLFQPIPETSMTPRQITLVRNSFAAVAPIADTAAALFYGHLFAADPSLRSLFKGDMAQQGARLMQMIGSAVGLLEKPQVLLPVLRQLGARHAGYGVQAPHYDTVGAALIKTLAQGLGEAFDDETRAAWVAVYGLIASTMMVAAQEAVPAAAQEAVPA